MEFWAVQQAYNYDPAVMANEWTFCQVYDAFFDLQLRAFAEA